MSPLDKFHSAKLGQQGLVDEFVCVECSGKGWGYDNLPSPNKIACDDCGGSGAVDASEYLDQCRHHIVYARTAFHLRWKANRPWAWEALDEAIRWLNEAKRARASFLKQEHHGAAHINAKIEKAE